MAQENIKSRKYYRVHNGETWDRMHFVTDANSVDSNDGYTMENKVGAIKGITTSTDVTEEGYAADATVVAALSDSLGGLNFAQDAEGNWGYIPSGADAVIPFKNGWDFSEYAKVSSGQGQNITITMSQGFISCTDGYDKPDKVILKNGAAYKVFQLSDANNVWGVKSCNENEITISSTGGGIYTTHRAFGIK